MALAAQGGVCPIEGTAGAGRRATIRSSGWRLEGAEGPGEQAEVFERLAERLGRTLQAVRKRAHRRKLVPRS